MISASNLSIRTAVSYVIDWAFIVAVAIGGGILSTTTGWRRPFSLADRSIAYPRESDIVTIEAAGLACFVGPALIILVLAFVTPGVHRYGEKRRFGSWRNKFWDANVGWLGLGLALATTLFFTSGLKVIVGKPRPNMLAICEADVDAIERFRVGGGTGTQIESDAPALVTHLICRQTDTSLLNDAFFAFPSGHSSMSWAGLLYLSLWLSMRFSVAFPYLGHHVPAPTRKTQEVDVVGYYNERKAAPPLWLVTIALVPIGVALFICASRYADFHHAGIDIFAGCVIGIICGWSSFRLYHMPVQRGFGMAWSPRKEEYAFTGRMPWHHWMGDDNRHGPIDEENRGIHRNSTSVEEMLEYREGRESAQYGMQPMPHSTLSRP